MHAFNITLSMEILWKLHLKALFNSLSIAFVSAHYAYCTLHTAHCFHHFRCYATQECFLFIHLAWFACVCVLPPPPGKYTEFTTKWPSVCICSSILSEWWSRATLFHSVPLSAEFNEILWRICPQWDPANQFSK